MNNLIFAGLIGAFGLSLFLGQRAHLEENSVANAQLLVRIEKARNSTRQSAAEGQRLQSLFVTEEQTLQGIRSKAAQNMSPTEAPVEAVPLNPEHEGWWPADRPYFYLAKARLEGLDYWPTADDDALSETAVTLFGMTVEEQRAATDVYHRMREELRAIESAAAIPTNVPPSIASDPGAKTSVFMPALPKEILDEVHARFRTGLLEALGGDRGPLLARRIDETFDDGSYRMGKDRFITLIRDEQGVRLVITDERGNMTSMRDVGPDNRQRVPPDFAHFFKPRE